MKRVKLLMLLTIVLFYSCNESDKSAIKNVESGDELVIKQNIFYIKDSNTNLCYAVLKSLTYGARTVYSLTCISCDSVKNKK